MVPARGDSKPCTHNGCVGKMHYKRDSDNNAFRWVCDTDPQH